jgi:single-strand DNA-binding protein
MTAQQITFTGNATQSPELRYGPSGMPVARVSIACSDRYRDTSGEWVDGETYFQRVTCFGALALNVSESVDRGSRLVVTGRLSTSQYDHTDTATGETTTRYSTDFHAEDVAVSLKWATARPVKVSRATAAPAAEPPAPSPWDVPATAGAGPDF